MLGLPQSTEYGKKIPKQKFYGNINITANLKRIFVEQIKGISWTNKIASSTVNVADGQEVHEIEVFEIALTDNNLDEAVLLQIDREIPYHIIYVLAYDGKYQVWIGYKEKSISGSNAFKVSTYYHTDWLTEDKLQDTLKIVGTTLDAVYENFVKQVAGDRLQSDNSEDLKILVEKDNRRKEIEKQISALQSKIRKEKQLNRQMEMNEEVKRLRKELEKV